MLLLCIQCSRLFWDKSFIDHLDFKRGSVRSRDGSFRRSVELLPQFNRFVFRSSIDFNSSFRFRAGALAILQAARGPTSLNLN